MCNSNVWTSIHGASCRKKNAGVPWCDHVIMAVVEWNRLFCDTVQRCGRQPCPDESSNAPAEETWPWIQSDGFIMGWKQRAEWSAVLSQPSGFFLLLCHIMFFPLCGGPWKISNTPWVKKVENLWIKWRVVRGHLWAWRRNMLRHTVDGSSTRKLSCTGSNRH